MSKAAQRRLADKQRRAKTDPKYKPSKLDAERKAAREAKAASAQRIFNSSSMVKPDAFK